MIVFKKLVFRNFLSVGNNPVSIDLNSSKTTLIHGTNGSGKSTVLDALTYVLFNKPFRSINLPQIINSSNKKDLLAEVEFSIGKTDYMIVRGMKPKKFEIYKDGELLDSKASDKDNQAHLEQNILKMNLKTFIQVVILGSGNYVPFMQMSSPGRRECVEEFLDIKVFSAMSMLAKDRLRGLKDKAQELKGEMSTLMYKIEVQQERIQEIKDRSATDTQELNENIDGNTKDINEKLKLVDGCSVNEKEVQEALKGILDGNPQGKLNEFKTIITKLQTKIDRLDKDSSFYDDNKECPTCRQDISTEIRNTMMAQNGQERIKLQKAIDEAVQYTTEYEGTMRVVDTKRKEIQSLQQSIFKYETEISSLQSQIRVSEAKLHKLSEDSGSVDKELGKLDTLKELARQYKDKYESVLVSLKEHELIVNLLKDSGIKTQIVRKYLPLMNKSIRRYMTDLDFPIHFTLDEEFNETVSSPMYQDFSYSSFSEGQKARIDLSLLFCWREVARLKNSVSCNILVLDEVFSSSLDEVGKENLLALLRYGMDDSQRILVVDHTLSQEFKDKFDRNIEVSKSGGFSVYS